MYLARLLPDWYSLDSVRHAHSFLEAIGLVFFALLVVFDVLAIFRKTRKKEQGVSKRSAYISSL
jgi:cbb3-type cytochrome oxidase subunit 3